MSHIIAMSVDLAGQLGQTSKLPMFTRPLSRRTRVISIGLALTVVSFGLSLMVAVIQDL